MKQSETTPRFAQPFASQADANLVAYPLPDTKKENGRLSLLNGFPVECFTALSAGGIPPSGADFNGILRTLSEAIRSSEAGQIRPFEASYAAQIGGYPRGALVCDPDNPARLFISLYDNNGDDPTQQDGSRSWNALTNSIEALKTALTSETQRAQNAEAGLLPLSGGTLTGSLWSTGTFNPGKDIFATQPIGAALDGEELYLQLVNDNTKGETYGRLVLRDGGGNYHIPLQVDNHDAVTTNGDLTVTGQTTHQGAVLSTGTYNTAANVFVTQPIGAAMDDEQFYLQLVNDNNTGTTSGRLVLRDGGGHFHTPLSVDNHDNTTINGTLTVTGETTCQSPLFTAGSYQLDPTRYTTQPIGTTMSGIQFYLQLENDNDTGTSTGRLVLRDGSGAFHTPIQIDNHDTTTLNGKLVATGPLDIVGGIYNGAYYGGQCKSTVSGTTANASLQLQGTDGNETAALVLQDNKGGWHNWGFNANGALTAPSGRNYPEINGINGRVVTQVFQVTGQGPYATITFPQPFLEPPTGLSMMTNQEAKGDGSNRTYERFATVGNVSENSHVPAVSKENVTVSIWSVAGGITVRPWTLWVTATGIM